MFRNSFANGLSATVVAGLDKCCARADLPCRIWNGSGKHLHTQNRSWNHGRVLVIWISPGFGAEGRKNVADRIGAHWHDRFRDTHARSLLLFVRVNPGDQWRNPDCVWSPFMYMYISPLLCGQPNRQEIAGLMTCARDNGRAVLLENRQGRAARWMDGGGQAPLQLRRSAVTPTGRCHVPARTMPVCAGAPAAWLAEALLS